ncbi:hypothetical protein HMPREF3192_00458 [Atopobium deltae]|uniref:Uncharacterized protein n=1 Tax=Atopobium deltae TaxID=1393034 RepID=A0A133XW11_9ACTN|nr:hypothetical protein HMPREF3192_00458 [Atopobium deltae]
MGTPSMVAVAIVRCDSKSSSQEISYSLANKADTTHDSVHKS